jgi:ABC-type multidrug transport system ATPase subunit
MKRIFFSNRNIALGHNGAGKSTLIRMLTGVTAPTHGEAFVFGLSVREDVAELQKVMGVCPQDDLLWLDLSARQHLRTYAQFKGVPLHMIEGEITRILHDVNLTADADNAASTYSGGMKRRLSVGIASVGSPQITFLDEPTTGMDPLSKRRVWSMIERLKGFGMLLLTTHSMVCCCGSPLFLGRLIMLSCSCRKKLMPWVTQSQFCTMLVYGHQAPLSF